MVLIESCVRKRRGEGVRDGDLSFNSTRDCLCLGKGSRVFVL